MEVFFRMFSRISFVQLGLQELMDIHETLRGAATDAEFLKKEGDIGKAIS